MARDVVVRIVGDSKGFSSAMDAAGGSLAKIGPIAAGAGAAIVGGLAVAGKALYDLGGSFDSAFDNIRVTTGATGETLKGLEKDFKGVLKNTATDFDTASTAVADLNQRLDLTGQPLQDLTKQFIDFSDLTGTDVKANIENLTRVFGDWGITGAKQAMTLDRVFRATQAAGIGVERLTELVVQFGAPLRGLGFEFTDSIALLSKWEKEGVNVELVMGAMKKAFGSFAKEGADAPKAFRAFLDEVQKAPSLSAAATIAIDRLGVKAGPDFAAAVQEGRFEYDELLKTINIGSDTVAKATEDTADLSEKWQIFKNNVLVGLEPLASGVFNSINSGMERMGGFLRDHVMPHLVRFGEYFKTTVMPLLKTALTNVKTFIDEGLARLEQKFKDNQPQIERLMGWLEDLGRFALEKLLPAFIELSGRGLGQFIAGIGYVVEAISRAVDAIVWMANVAIDHINRVIQGVNLIKPGADVGSITRLAPVAAPRTTGGVSGGGSFFVNGVAMASGGIVTSPTIALIGEAGPEAVVPLSRGGGGLGSTVITINFNGVTTREGADQVVEALEDHFRRGGAVGNGRGGILKPA